MIQQFGLGIVESRQPLRLEKMQGIFNYFDVDKDGILDSKEFINFVNQLLIPSNEKIEEVGQSEHYIFHSDLRLS